MSMTREEAINRIKDHMAAHHIGEYPHIKLKEAFDLALTALCPVNREQVEKWRGEWITVHDTSDRDWSKCGSCQAELDGLEDAYNFCPACGAPMTDEAVEMVMRRLEALKDGSTSD